MIILSIVWVKKVWIKTNTKTYTVKYKSGVDYWKFRKT